MSEELNCSAGAKILIDRMKENPDEFKGLKWNGLISSIVRGDTNALISDRDRVALREAYGMYVQEPMLMQNILNTLLEPDPPDELNQKYAKALAASMNSTKQGILSAGLNKAFDSAYNDYRNIYGTPST